MHVAVIEDDANIAELLRVILGSGDVNHTTLCTSDFDRLVPSIPWETVNAVICDRFLGEADGVDILAWLETTHPHVHRVMMTADDSLDPSTAHAHVFLPKVASVESIRNALKQAHNGNT